MSYKVEVAYRSRGLRIKVPNKVHALLFSTTFSYKKECTILTSTESRINSIIDTNLEIHYHKSCVSTYVKRILIARKREKSIDSA